MTLTLAQFADVGHDDGICGHGKHGDGLSFYLCCLSDETSRESFLLAYHFRSRCRWKSELTCQRRSHRLSSKFSRTISPEAHANEKFPYNPVEYPIMQIILPSQCHELLEK